MDSIALAIWRMAGARALADRRNYIAEVGNTPEDEDGVQTDYPAPLSGEFAGTFSSADLQRFCESNGVTDSDTIEHYADIYENAYHDVFMHGFPEGN